MTENDIPHPSPLGKTIALEILAAVRENPEIRAEFRAILLATESDAWIAQTDSPLGSRRHRAAVRSAVAAGDDRARIVGRRHLARRDLIDAWLLASGRAAVSRAAVSRAAADDLADELGLEVVA